MARTKRPEDPAVMRMLRVVGDEHYTFLRLYAIDFDGVRHSLRMLSRYRRADVRYCILREIVVAYARPFSGNKGETGATHSLSNRHVPVAARALHAHLLKLRGELFAHTDLRFHQSRVARWPRGDGGHAYTVSFRHPDYADLERRLPTIQRLVGDILGSVEQEIAEIESRTR